MAVRRCKGKTRAGERCRSTSLIGDEAGATAGNCFAHQPEDFRRSRGFGGPQPGSGRPRRPRIVDVLREWVEEHAQELLEPYVLGLQSTTTVLVRARDEDGNELAGRMATEIPDIEVRQKTAERLQDRVYGKPRQTIEHAGPAEGSPIAVEFSLDDRAREAIAGALRTRPAAGAQ